MSSDTYFPSIKSGQGNTCSQFFVGDVSDRWQTYPLKSESLNGIALQDYTCYVGNPTLIKTYNVQSEIRCTWKTHCRCYCVPNYTTEPKSPWQNPAERGIQDLGCMVCINMHQTMHRLKYMITAKNGAVTFTTF